MRRRRVGLSPKLRDLLKKTTEVEQAEVRRGSLPPTLTPDAIHDLAAQVVGPEVDDLAEQIKALQDELYAVTSSAVPAADAPDAVYGTEKTIQSDDSTGQPCARCGSTGVDALVDGTLQCEDCGWPLNWFDNATAVEFDDHEGRRGHSAGR